MPSIQRVSNMERHWNQFSYSPDEELHPVLLAVQAGNLERFVAATQSLASVHLSEGDMQPDFASHLLLQGQDSVYGYGVCRNIVWLAAWLGHADLITYMLENKERLGLTDDHFIQAVDEANRRDSSIELKHALEADPGVITAYNQEMRPKQYQPSLSEPQPVDSTYLRLIV